MASRTAKRKQAARLIARAMNKVAGRRAVDSEKFRTNLRAVMRRTIDEEFIDVTAEERQRFQVQYTLVGLSGQIGQREGRGGWHGPSTGWKERGWKKLTKGRWRDPSGVLRKESKGWTFVRETFNRKTGKRGMLWKDSKGRFNTSANLKRSKSLIAHHRKIRILAEASGLKVSEVRKAWKELGPDAEEIIRAVAGGVYPEEKQED